MRTTNAVFGTNYGGTDPLKLAFNASGGASVNVGVKQGSYYLVATVDCICKYGKANTVAAAAFPTTQDGSQAGGFYVLALTRFYFDAPSAGYLAALAVGAGAGTLYIVGPVGESANA